MAEKKGRKTKTEPAAEAAKTAPEKAGEPGGTAPASSDRWDPFASLRHEVDRLFDDFTGAWGAGPISARGRNLLAPFRGLPGAWAALGPAVDIVESEKDVRVRVELPGMDEADIEVEVEGSFLKIRGEKKEEIETGGKDSHVHLSERRYGSFERVLQIPASANADAAEASFSKGVLTVAFPKAQATRRSAKKVEVRGG